MNKRLLCSATIVALAAGLSYQTSSMLQFAGWERLLIVTLSIVSSLVGVNHCYNRELGQVAMSMWFATISALIVGSATHGLGVESLTPLATTIATSIAFFVMSGLGAWAGWLNWEDTDSKKVFGFM